MSFLYSLTNTWLSNFWSIWAIVLFGILILILIIAQIFTAKQLKEQRVLKLTENLKALPGNQKNRRFQSLGIPKSRLGKLLYESQIPLTEKKLHLYLIAGSISGILFGILVSNIFLSFLLGMVLPLIGIFFLWTKAIDQKKRLIQQLPIFLQAMANTLQAGYSIQHSFGFVAQEMDQPLKKHIKEINRKIELQVSLEEILTEFAETINHPEINFFTESTIIQIKTGGNLVTVFKKIATLIEEKLKLQRDIKSFTSQGRMSGILIAGLWPGSLLVFNWLSPSHVALLFHTPLGNFLLGISIILELIGFFCIWRITQVKL